MLMHSLDTVKTRQQGDPHIPPRYTSMSSSYLTIFRQEGFRRGLYSGVTPALLGSFPGTVIFFGSYEWTKRHMIDAGIAPSISYLSSGKLTVLSKRFPCCVFVADLMNPLLLLFLLFDLIQDFWRTWLLRLFTYLPKFLRLDCNYKDDTTILISILVIIIDPRQMHSAP